MKRRIRLISPVLIMVLTWGVLSQAASPARFGPYAAVTINSEVIRGVKVDDSGKIWLLLNPLYRDLEIVLKASNAEGSGYRNWHTGEQELVSPANPDKEANEWTDWIETDAPYIEYWMSGRKVLHLKKVE